MTALFYLYYEQLLRDARARRVPVMLVVSGAVGFLPGTGRARAQEIQPLVPGPAELVDEVPANFIGWRLRAVGLVAFALPAQARRADKLGQLTTAGGDGHRAVLRAGAVPQEPIEGAVELLGGVLRHRAARRRERSCAGRRRIADRLPGRGARRHHVPLDRFRLRVLFTIATILGAFWAAEAWGYFGAGTRGDLGADRLAELHAATAAHAADEGPTQLLSRRGGR